MAFRFKRLKDVADPGMHEASASGTLARGRQTSDPTGQNEMRIDSDQREDESAQRGWAQLGLRCGSSGDEDSPCDRVGSVVRSKAQTRDVEEHFGVAIESQTMIIPFRARKDRHSQTQQPPLDPSKKAGTLFEENISTGAS